MPPPTTALKKHVSCLKGNNVITKYTVRKGPDSRFLLKHSKKYHDDSSYIILDSDDESQTEQKSHPTHKQSNPPSKRVIHLRKTLEKPQRQKTVFDQVASVKKKGIQRPPILQKVLNEPIVISDSDDDLQDAPAKADEAITEDTTKTPVKPPAVGVKPEGRPTPLTAEVLKRASIASPVISVSAETISQRSKTLNNQKSNRRRGSSDPHGMNPDRRNTAPNCHDETFNQGDTTPKQHSRMLHECGRTPDRCGMTPGQHGMTPDKRGVTPDQCGMTPGQHGMTPDKCGMTPDKCDTIPGRRGITPDRQGVAPYVWSKSVWSTAPIHVPQESPHPGHCASQPKTRECSVAEEAVTSRPESVASAPQTPTKANKPMTPESCPMEPGNIEQIFDESVASNRETMSSDPENVASVSNAVWHCTVPLNTENKNTAASKPCKDQMPSSTDLLPQPVASKSQTEAQVTSSVEPMPPQTQSQQSYPAFQAQVSYPSASLPRPVALKSSSEARCLESVAPMPSAMTPPPCEPEPFVNLDPDRNTSPLEQSGVTDEATPMTTNSTPPASYSAPITVKTAPVTPERGITMKKPPFGSPEITGNSITDEYLKMINKTATREQSFFPPVRNPLLTPLRDKLGIEYSLPSPGYRKPHYTPRESTRKVLNRSKLFFKSKEGRTAKQVREAAMRSEARLSGFSAASDSSDSSARPKTPRVPTRYPGCSKGQELRDRNQNIVSCFSPTSSSTPTESPNKNLPVKLVTVEEFLQLRKKKSMPDGSSSENHPETTTASSGDTTDSSPRKNGAERLLMRNAADEIQRQISLSKGDEPLSGSKLTKTNEKAGISGEMKSPSSLSREKEGNRLTRSQRSDQSSSGEMFRRAKNTPTTKDITDLIDELSAGDHNAKTGGTTVGNKKSPLKNQTQNEQMKRTQNTVPELKRVQSNDSRSSSSVASEAFSQKYASGRQKNVACSESSDSSDFDGIYRLSSSSQHSSERHRLSSKSPSQGSDSQHRLEDIENQRQTLTSHKTRKSCWDQSKSKRKRDSHSPDASPALKRARSIYQIEKDDKKLKSFIDNLLDESRKEPERDKTKHKDRIHSRRALFTSLSSSSNGTRSMLREGPDHPLTKMLSKANLRGKKTDLTRHDCDITSKQEYSRTPGTPDGVCTSRSRDRDRKKETKTSHAKGLSDEASAHGAPTVSCDDSNTSDPVNIAPCASRHGKTSTSKKKKVDSTCASLTSNVSKHAKTVSSGVNSGTLVTPNALRPGKVSAYSETSDTSDSEAVGRRTRSALRQRPKDVKSSLSDNVAKSVQSVTSNSCVPTRPVQTKSPIGGKGLIAAVTVPNKHSSLRHAPCVSNCTDHASETNISKFACASSATSATSEHNISCNTDHLAFRGVPSANSASTKPSVSTASTEPIGTTTDTSAARTHVDSASQEDVVIDLTQSDDDDDCESLEEDTLSELHDDVSEQSYDESASRPEKYGKMLELAITSAFQTQYEKSSEETPERTTDETRRCGIDDKIIISSSDEGTVLSRDSFTAPPGEFPTPNTQTSAPTVACMPKESMNTFKVTSTPTVPCVLRESMNAFELTSAPVNRRDTLPARQKGANTPSADKRHKKSPTKITSTTVHELNTLPEREKDTLYSSNATGADRSTATRAKSHEEIFKHVTDALEGALSRMVDSNGNLKNDLGNMAGDLEKTGDEPIKVPDLEKDSGDLGQETDDLQNMERDPEIIGRDLAKEACDLAKEAFDLNMEPQDHKGHDLLDADLNPEDIGRDLAKEARDLVQKAFELSREADLEHEGRDLEDTQDQQYADGLEPPAALQAGKTQGLKSTEVSKKHPPTVGSENLSPAATGAGLEINQKSTAIEPPILEKHMQPVRSTVKNTPSDVSSALKCSKLTQDSDPLQGLKSTQNTEGAAVQAPCSLNETLITSRSGEPQDSSSAEDPGTQSAMQGSNSDDLLKLQGSKSTELSDSRPQSDELTDAKEVPTKSSESVTGGQQHQGSGPSSRRSPPAVSHLPTLDLDRSTEELFDVNGFFDHDGDISTATHDDDLSHIDFDFPEFPCDDIVPDLRLQENLKPEIDKPDQLPDLSDPAPPDKTVSAGTEDADSPTAEPKSKRKKKENRTQLETKTRSGSLEQSEFMMSQLLTQSFISSQEPTTDSVCGSDLLKEIKMFQARSPPLTPRNPRKRHRSSESMSSHDSLPPSTYVPNSAFNISHKKHGASLARLVRQKKKEHEVDKMEEILLSDLKKGGFRQTLENSDENENSTRTSDCDNDTKRAINLMKKDWGTLPELMADTKVFESGRLSYCHHSMTLQSNFTEGSFQSLSQKLKFLVSRCTAQNFQHCKRFMSSLLNTAETRVQTYKWLLKILQYHPDCDAIERILQSSLKENRFKQSPLTFCDFKSSMLGSGAKSNSFSNQDSLRTVKEDPLELSICEKCARRRRKPRNLRSVAKVLGTTVFFHPLTLQHNQQIDFATFLMLLLKDRKFSLWLSEILSVINIILESMKNWAAMKILLTRRILVACPRLQNIQEIAFELRYRSPHADELSRVISFAVLKLHVYGEDAESMILDEYSDPEALVDIVDHLRPDNLELLLIPDESEERGIGSQKRSFFHLSLLLPLLNTCIGNECRDNVSLVAFERISSILRSTNKRIRDNGAIYRSQVKYELSLFIKNLRILIQKAPKIHQASIFKYLRSAPVHAEVIDNQTEEESSDESSAEEVSYNDGDDEVKVQPFSSLQRKTSAFDDELEIAEVIKSKILKSGKKGL